MSQDQNDPYVYPSTNVLINKFDLKDDDALQEVEGVIFALKSQETLPVGNFDYEHLKAIHRHFFGDVYEWAGEQRTVDISKGDSYFAHTGYIAKEADKLFLKLKNENFLAGLQQAEFCNRLSYYFNEVNALHPFREGNGRTQRAFCELIAENAGYKLDWTLTQQREYIQASIEGFVQGDYSAMQSIFTQIITKLDRHNIKVNDIELSASTTNKINIYVEKQLELTELFNKKNKHMISDQALSKKFGQQARQLSDELKGLAKEILSNHEVEQFLKQPYLVSLSKQGGFVAINERIKNREGQLQDILAVLRYAQNTTRSISQSLNQEQNQGVGGRHK